MKLLITIAALLVSAPAALAAEMTLHAYADGAVQYSGVLGYTVYDGDATNRTSMSGGNNVRDSIYEFDLSALPDGATITAATLFLTTSGLVSNTSSPATVSFYGFTGDGVITDADHGNLSADTLIAEEDYATGGSGPAVGTELNIALTDLAPMQAALDDAGSDYFGIRSETVSFVTFSVHSLEHGEATDVAPKMRIAYVPEPASLGLLTLTWPLLRRRG